VFLSYDRNMTTEEHRERHKERHKLLHSCLDELVADWIAHTRKLPSQATVLELMKWAAKQAEDPTP
jgi:hypothetical protein